MTKKKRVKAGTSKSAALQRKILFAHAYIVNGNNKTEAAITAGLSKKTAVSAGHRMSMDVEVQRIITQATEKAATKSGLSVERTLLEVARLAYSDPRKFYDAAGALIPVHQLDDDAAACIASIEVDEIGTGGNVIGHTKKIKHWDKNAALEKAMKYHGLYKEDNKQIGESLALHVAFGRGDHK